MPARAPQISTAAIERLVRLGARIRDARKAQGVTAVAAAEAAGLSRPTWHRIERGEPGVAMGAWAAAAEALHLALTLDDPTPAKAPPPLPSSIRLADFPELQKLAWQLEGVESISPQQALDLYERNWRHVDTRHLAPHEAALIEALTAALGGGRLLV
ncbi:MAG: helix-turn-helix transcriptional regulator [Caldimonas sp.]